MSEQKLALTHHYASLARHDVYAEKRADGYAPVRSKIVPRAIERHADDIQPIGVYPLIGARTRIGVIDFDDHNGTVGWDRMREVAQGVAAAAARIGLLAHPYRSGGGQGIHLWFTWPEAQSGAAVRSALGMLLGGAGLVEGTAGVAAGQAEIYPRQASVEEGKFGNLIALPGARKSAPLHLDTLHPMEWSSIDWPNIVMRESKVPPTIHEAETKPSAFVRLAGDELEVREALKRIPAHDYGTWLCVGLAVKHAFGADGLQLYDEWSKTDLDKYGGEAKTAAFFRGLKPDGRISLRTVFHLARERGWNGPSNPMVREMNARYGIYTHGRTSEIIIKGATGGPEEVFIGRGPFIDRLAPETIVQKADDGSEVRVSKARAWLNHPKASHYTRVEFDPSRPPGDNGDAWNLWSGFAVNPEPGDWSLLKAHLLDNVCRLDLTANNWMMNWMALGVQQPGLVIGTAPVLIGFPGTGKGVLAHAYGKLWGTHYLPVTHAEHVTGKFSGHFFARRFVFIDEGIFGGNRKDAGLIKTRITEPTVVLERKGVDAVTTKNSMIFMVASNEASVVPADKGDRRWMVLHVGDAHRGDRAYFGAIAEQMENGGHAAMLHELLHRDISSGPDPRSIIRTEALFEQVLLAQPPEVRYLHGILDEARLPQNWIAGPNSTTIKAMLVELHGLHRDARHVDLVRLGRFINKAIPEVRTAIGGVHFVKKMDGGFLQERSTQYDFPPLQRARDAFARYINTPIPWTIADEWQEDPDPRGEDDYGDAF